MNETRMLQPVPWYRLSPNPLKAVHQLYHRLWLSRQVRIRYFDTAYGPMAEATAPGCCICRHFDRRVAIVKEIEL